MPHRSRDEPGPGRGGWNFFFFFPLSRYFFLGGGGLFAGFFFFGSTDRSEGMYCLSVCHDVDAVGGWGGERERESTYFPLSCNRLIRNGYI